ncbi:bifunctional 3-dehydroquinate dehydratase/shikimate dehydrogenase, chloroplastic isoform X2 [Brachypodium distachyon]|uniref:bifunctional 3-dehydroquinate dehydratase/shikimate dehydrogenase, chloroplastic isoform X2 n=1 Tax=Brachypodium distachyon TaxID=15368 RepID=UPI0001D43C1D|nr:bifunctional 3-dehydroquinate dehydratase/shikimate dehydrogenase, chloroplastic isoform X2 [Brachypodium distachyon]|eukprot:XP_010237207.1 bifunctional 3-dehydroquinate dehydratase/shikimate dehydrogenase, chloroplastic isoform X2 [Brachypodium distachyon]
MAAAMSVSAVVPPAAAVARARTLLCVPATARAPREMAAEVAAAAALGADVAELRLDRLSGFAPRRDLPALLAKPRALPALVTYRPKWEGGEYDGDDEPRFEALQLAMELGAEYVDIELKVADKFMKFMSGKKPEKCKLIVSSHNYDNTPSAEELGSLLAQIQATGADIVKIATTATEIVDVSRMFQILVHCQVPIIGLVMNDRGFISRVLCPKFGGYLTFGSLAKGKESAPAQPTAADLINVYNIRQIGPDTRVFGIIGKPVGHSKSPILHNEAFRSVGMDAVYVPFLVDDLARFLTTYSSPDFAGFSCTIPHKEAAVRCCDEVDPIARDIGAVNTIVRRSDGKLVGYNTDYVGAISAIEDGIRASQSTHSTASPLAGRLFVVIGAGGAGKALAYGAKEKGARVVIANRTFARAQELANLIGGPALTLSELENYHPEEGMVLANTTAIGMHPNVNDTPLSKQALKSYAVVFDAVYTPKETRLLREAAECGATVVSGLEMFIRQAMGQFEHFTGTPVVDNEFRALANSLENPCTAKRTQGAVPKPRL